MSPSHEKLPRESVVYLTDITTAETDDRCGMRYWYSTLEGGHGILKRDTIVAALLDQELHVDLRTLATMEDISPAAIQLLIDDVLAHLTVEDRTDTAKMELLYRRLGQLAAFALYIEPTIRAEYETLPIDDEIVLDKDPLWIIARPDRLLRCRETGEVTYREYVPAGPGLNQERWLQSWHYQMRLHIGLAAAPGAISAPTHHPHIGQVMGLNQGFRSILDHRLIHPYVWGSVNGSVEKPETEWTHTSTASRTGQWTLAPVWMFPKGIVAWVQLCGEATAKSQFQLSPPVFLNTDALAAWCANRLHRQREITSIKAVATTNPALRSVYFRKTTQQCYPAVGDICPYLHACWDKNLMENPLTSPLYIANTSTTLGAVQ